MKVFLYLDSCSFSQASCQLEIWPECFESYGVPSL